MAATCIKPVKSASEVRADDHAIRLTEFLANEHPKLKRYLGEAKFTSLANAYITRHRLDHPSDRWYSRHLVDFLRKSPPYARKPELAELAALELCLNEAFHAADAPAITMNELAALDPDRLGSVIFNISPSVRRLGVRTNVTSLWACLRCEELPPQPIPLDAAQELLVWRQGNAPRFRLLGNEEAMAIDAARDGGSFGAICEMIAAMDDPGTAAARTATYLRGWIEAEIIAGLRLGRRTAPLQSSSG